MPRGQAASGEGDSGNEDQIDDTTLPQLSVDEVEQLGLPSVPTSWQPLPHIPVEPLHIVNLPYEFYIAAQRAGENVNLVSTVSSTSLAADTDSSIERDELHDRQAHCSVADRQDLESSEGCRSGWDLPGRVFLLFFSQPIFHLLAANTNLYAAKKDANGIN